PELTGLLRHQLHVRQQTDERGSCRAGNLLQLRHQRGRTRRRRFRLLRKRFQQRPDVARDRRCDEPRVGLRGVSAVRDRGQRGDDSSVWRLEQWTARARWAPCPYRWDTRKGARIANSDYESDRPIKSWLTGGRTLGVRRLTEPTGPEVLDGDCLEAGGNG